MLPNVLNKGRTISVISVKFTLIPCVIALLFAGTMATTADTPLNDPSAPLSRSKTADSTENQPKRPLKFPLIPSGNNLLSSLRFWEKKDTVPHVHTHSNGYSDKVPVVPHQPEVSSVANLRPVEPPDVSAENRQWAVTATHEPSANTYSARTYIEPVNTGYGDAPLPMMVQTVSPIHFSGSDGQTPQKTEIEKVPYSFYSFDTRDWVEFFPLQSDTQKNVPVMTQRTSLHSPTRNLSQNQSIENTEHNWDGQATILITDVSADPLVYSTVPQNAVPQNTATPSVPTAAYVGKALIDLSPSYQGRLRYTTACGVVVVQANFPLTEIASILEEIDTLQHDLYRYIGVPAPKEKIELCLFKDEASYMDFLKEIFPRAPRDRRALYIKLDNKPGTLLVQKSKNFEIDLRHEMTHAIIHASIPSVPIWLDEGLAKYFEVPLHHRAGGNPYMGHVRRNVQFGVVPSLARLTKLETIDDMGAKEYQDSWAWTHFLIHRSPETHQLLASYLQMLSRYPGTTDEEDDRAGHGFAIVFGEKILGISMTRREKSVPIPSLKLYLDDIMPNQREAFKEHFISAKK